jgi:hypothetical protein
MTGPRIARPASGNRAAPTARQQEMGFMMTNARTLSAVFGAFALLFSPAIVNSAAAAAKDYRFEVASAQPVGAGKTDVAVRLVRTTDNKPVTDAVIFENKADMGPAGMAEMPGKVAPMPPGQDGLYHFATQTGMAGTWALHLAAKVQGETETVRGTVDFDAK